jgi:uncharacterized membrane protein
MGTIQPIVVRFVIAMAVISAAFDVVGALDPLERRLSAFWRCR